MSDPGGPSAPSDADCDPECPPRCQRADAAEALEASRTPSSHVEPSTEVLAQSSRRLALMAATFALAVSVSLGLNLLLYDVLGWTPAAHNDLNRAKYVALIALSLVVMGVARWSRLADATKLHIGLAYEVLGAFVISVQGYADPLSLAQYNLGHVSWLCVWITLFPLVAPSAPLRATAAGVLAACMAPFALALWVAIGHAQVPTAQVMVEAFVPNFVCAGMAAGPAWVMHSLGTQVSRAAKEVRRLGSYQLVERLGRGGMGEVWRAEHSMLARPAAVKLVKKELLGQNDPVEQQVVLKRFEREARATAALRSPHTVSLYDFGVTDDGAFYYVMELLVGLDLETLVERHGPLPPARAVHLLRQACASLAEAHVAGLIHRDVKPANIYACRLGLEHDFVKVLDFGLVADLDRSAGKDAKLTGEGFIVGTPAFMAPEMVRGTAGIDGRADLYALGCVAFWLLTGRYVFEGESPMTILIDHAKTPAPAPSKKALQPIPPDLDAVVLACLAKDPAERPATAQELSRRLADSLGPGQAWTPEQAREWWETTRPVVPRDEGPLVETKAPRTPSRMSTMIRRTGAAAV